MLTLRKLTLLILCILMNATILSAQNWPQWRGNQWDSKSDATELPVEFNRDKNMAWRVELPGAAGASPVIWGEQIFLTSVKGDSELELLCISTAGKTLWTKELMGDNVNIRMDSGNMASPSPSTDGEHVWANTGSGFLECFTMDGEPVWHIDLQEKYGKFDIQFGMTSTPILFEGKLYLQLMHGPMRGKGTSLGHIVCLDAKTGEQVWYYKRETDGTAENRHSYASPVIMEHNDDHCLVTHGGDYVIGHSLKDGSELWRCGGLNPKGDGYNPFLRFVSSPTFTDGMLLVPTAKRRSVVALKPGISGDVTNDDNAKFWVLEKGTPDVACPVSHNGFVYLAGEKGVMTVLDSSNGEEVYSKRMFADRHRATPLVADGKLYINGRDGTVVVLEQGDSGNVLAENKLDETITASPAVTNGRIYIRTWNALYCFEKK